MNYGKKDNILLIGIIALVSSIAPFVAGAADKEMLFSVPFTTQAPLAHWTDARQQDGCEEASAIMAVAWARGEKLGSKKEVEKRIIALADWEEGKYGSYHDTSARDTGERILKAYFGYKNFEVKENIKLEDMKSALAKGHIVIVPANGQRLKNPNFKRPGPERHNLVVKGYDPDRREFITNDPGTRKGEGYRYPERVLFNAIRDYPTGNHLPIKGVKMAMIEIWKN